MSSDIERVVASLTRSLDHAAQPVVGYADRWSTIAGGTFDVHASATSASGTVRLVRLGHDGTSWSTTPIAGESQRIDLAHRSIRYGSYVEAADVEIPLEGVTVSVWVRLTAFPPDGAEAIVAALEGGPPLVLQPDGTLHWAGASVTRPLDRYRWLHVEATVAPGHPSRVKVTPHRPHPLESAELRVEGPLWTGLLPGRTSVVFGVGLDGRIDLPTLAAAPGSPPLHVWDASVAGGRPDVPDAIGSRPATVVGLAMQLCQGVRHDGRSNDPRVDPVGHSAIHLHSDDLEDARWPTTATCTVPAGTPSGVVAAEIVTPEGTDRIPVVVRGNGTAPVLVLLPTLTYLAYANEHANPPEIPGKIPEVAADFGRANRFGSWYDQHRDGSRWWLLTSRRPLLGIRPEHRFRVLGGEHGLSHDLMLLGWLERRGIAYEVACDHDLHREGAALFRGHRVVVTGAHPEYWTAPMLDGLSTYLNDGGRLAYLGGNGFLWTTAIDDERPWVHECRKSFADNAVMDFETGDDHLQTTGDRAGMWQMVDRPPAALTGVATTAMGFEGAGFYRRLPASADPRVEPVFRGIQANVFGDHGEILGGAAGYEVDMASAALGTPPHALVVATATVPDSYITFAPAPFPSPSGETPVSRRRSDVVFFETPNGGRVFSVGSIMWTDAMRSNGDDNDVSRITENVIRWFAEHE